MFPVTWRFAVGVCVYTPTKPALSVNTVVGQKPEFVAPVPVWFAKPYKTVTLGEAKLEVEVVNVSPTLIISVVLYEGTARTYVVPPEHKASSEI